MTSRRVLPQVTLDRIGVQFEIDFYEHALLAEPDRVVVLEALASALHRAGRKGETLRLDRRLAALLPENPVAHYNLACSLSLTKEIEGALAALERAIALGYCDFRQIARDPDLALLRCDPRFRELRSRGRAPHGRPR